MSLEKLVREMPKVELHVHLEGSIRPETVLELARRNGVSLPANTVDGLREWYTFRDFPHFVEVYVAVSKCIRTADDLELIAREFLKGQAEQNILHSEVTYTASTIEKYAGIPWADQRDALRRAVAFGEEELNVSCRFILDIVRQDSAERGEEIARWALDAPDLVVALGLSGEERLGKAEDHGSAIRKAKEGGLAFVPHAGETVGPESIRDCLPFGPARIGHGVRAVEDGKLVAELRDRGIPLEVCPTSNVRLGVFSSLEEHPFPRLLDEACVVTINSDDPPMFGTTLSEEFLRCAETFDLSPDILYTLTMNAVNASLLSPEEKNALRRRVREEWPDESEDEEEGTEA
ncbi:adenosine deaminase [bacterium]|nr:MAG: adenosine deaminase [bacterium]